MCWGTQLQPSRSAPPPALIFQCSTRVAVGMSSGRDAACERSADTGAFCLPQRHGVDALGLTADVTDRDGLRAAFEKAVAHFGT